MQILGIETTCDDTSVAVVQSGTSILGQDTASQEDIHAQYGGVYPEKAAQRHSQTLPEMVDQFFEKRQLSPQNIEAIAVSYGPGLIGSILTGLNCAKTLSVAWGLPFIGINHVEAHLYAAIMGRSSSDWRFPSLGLVISGGHTILLQINHLGEYQRLGSTQDDAIGEAFDKAAILLGLSYPGGAKIEKLAEQGDPYAYPFKSAHIKKAPLDFSFSGLKTAIFYAKQKESQLTDTVKKNLAASFQRAAFATILDKLQLALSQKTYKSLWIGGGVAANQYFRSLLEQKVNLPIFFPPRNLCQDNAAMIAGLGYHKLQENPKGDSLTLLASSRIPFL